MDCLNSNGESKATYWATLFHSDLPNLNFNEDRVSLLTADFRERVMRGFIDDSDWVTQNYVDYAVLFGLDAESFFESLNLDLDFCLQ